LSSSAVSSGELSLSGGHIIGIIAVGGLLLLGFFWIVFGSTLKERRLKEREKSRREIAAYVAEGTISPEDAERILAAGEPADVDR